MIKELTLKSFGKFTGKKISFGPITLFIGDNESGKSTIFDSILDNICKPGMNISEGKRLAERYGDERDSELKTIDGSNIKIDTNEFLNLYAIHAGSISLDFSSGKSWMDKVKSSIFTGGIDPSKIADDFENLSKDKGMLKHVIKYKNKVTELKELENNLDVLNKNKENILLKEKGLKEQKEKLNSLLDEINIKESELNKHSFELDQQDKIRQREDLFNSIKLIENYQKLERELSLLEHFKDDRTGELNKHLKSIDELEDKLGRKESELKYINDGFATKERNISELEPKLESAGALSGMSSQLLGKIDQNKPKSVIRTIFVWRKSLLTLSAIPLTAGIASFFLLPYLSITEDLLIRISSISGGVIIALILVFLSRKKEEREESPDIAHFITGIKDEFQSRSGGNRLKSEGIDGIIYELMKYQGEYDSLNQNKINILNDLAESRGKKEKAIKEEASVKKDLTDSKATLDSILRKLNVTDKDEYIERRKEYIFKQNDLETLKIELHKLLTHYKASDADTLKIDLQARVSNLNDDIQLEKKQDSELNRIKKLKENTNKELEKLKSEKSKIKTDLDKGEGVVKGSFGNIPEQILEKERAIIACKQELEDMKTDREAAGIVSDIFKKISLDSSMVFEELGKEISIMFGDILPEIRDITIGDFKTEEISLTDAGGNKRNLENVSTGTHDSFLLAAKLVLALRSHEKGKPGFIILDEPFHALDDHRKLKALELLKKFHEDYGWQIVLFSKDTDIGNHMINIFPESLIHELEVGY